MFITSAQALDMLQHHAPRAWCKRLLLWLAFEGPLEIYFLSGRLIEKRGAAAFLVEAQGEGEDSEISLSRVEQHFSTEVAESLRAIGCPEKPGSLSEVFKLGGVEVNREDWRDDPKAIPIGAFIYADEVDFESGRLRADDLSPRFVESALFGEAEVFYTEFDDSSLEVELGGMCFEQSAIEMLAPGAPPPAGLAIESDSGQQPKSRAGPGRSRKWDWEGALANIVSVANTPDGLPEGHGAQAAIERMMLDWFTATANGAPQESEIRKRAAQVMSALDQGRK